MSSYKAEEARRQNQFVIYASNETHVHLKEVCVCVRSAVHSGKRSPEERTEPERRRRSPEKPTRVRGKENRDAHQHIQKFLQKRPLGEAEGFLELLLKERIL